MGMDDVISNLEQQIRWIEEIECHKFPGWLNVTNAIRDALALLKEQEAVVRCKDCKFYPDGKGTTKWLPCREIIVPPMWFCADGKKSDS